MIEPICKSVIVASSCMNKISVLIHVYKTLKYLILSLSIRPSSLVPLTCQHSPSLEQTSQLLVFMFKYPTIHMHDRHICDSFTHIYR